MKQAITSMKWSGLLAGVAAVAGVSCAGPPEDDAVAVKTSAVTLAPRLDPTTIPKFTDEMPRFSTYRPTVTRDAQGRPIRKEYTVHIAKFTEQQLPAGFPATPLFGYGGDVVRADGTQVFERTSPGPKFEQTKGVPALVHYRNELDGEHPLAVDPTLDWANPNAFPKPSPPFLAFPSGYPQAQSPIVHTTHTHGIEVLPAFDGTPDTWFTATGVRGPEYVSNDYQQPSSNQSAAFWYHDHAFGVTRLDVGFGLSGYSILRDPQNALDRLGNSDILGFEDFNDWTATGVAVAPDTRHTQGAFSVAVAARGFVTLKSRPFELAGALRSTVSFDFFLPTQQPNPSAPGAVQVYADCPSKGINSLFIGQAELTGRPFGAFSRLSVPVPAAAASRVGTFCEDFDFQLGVNVPVNATGTYLVDNLSGAPVVAASPLPQGQFEVPIIVQDRTFRTDGTVFYPTVGRNPDINPYWELINDSDTNVVNGKVWPNMTVKRHAYRLRFLNSANARFYHLKFSNGMSFQVIGSDGGYLRQPQTITDFTMGVTERVDVIVDFSPFPAGTKIVLQNDEQHFPPIGAPVDPNTDGTIMQFTVTGSAPVAPKPLPSTLNAIATLTPNRPTRTLIQNVETDDQGRILQAELDGQLFHEETTELPTIGATEDWQFVNLTPLTHNKHVHLIEFQVVSRQDVDATRYLADWKAANGNPPFAHPTLKLPVEPYLLGSPEGPKPEESGWKDTVRTPAGQVTRIRIRWAPQQLPTGAGSPGVNDFPFDPTNGIGFVWHCHLVEHEDNEMMRPMTVIPAWVAGRSYPVGNRRSPGIGAGLVDFNGVDYAARVANSSTQPPDQRPDLWERINNGNGDWAVQIIYQVGDRVFFQGHVYRALQQHQASNANQPGVTPAVWQLL